MILRNTFSQSPKRFAFQMSNTPWFVSAKYMNLYADILFLGKFKVWPSRDMDTGSVSLIVLMMKYSA